MRSQEQKDDIHQFYHLTPSYTSQSLFPKLQIDFKLIGMCFEKLSDKTDYLPIRASNISLLVDKASSQLHSRLRSLFQCSNASYTAKNAKFQLIIHCSEVPLVFFSLKQSLTHSYVLSLSGLYSLLFLYFIET